MCRFCDNKNRPLFICEDKKKQASMNDSIILDLATDASETTKDYLITTLRDKLNGHKRQKIIALCAREMELTLPQSIETIISTDNIDLCFKAKSLMDADNITDFVLVTSLMMKKYWETVFLHMFSHVHNWSIRGVDVPNQPSGLVRPEVDSVESSIKNYFKTVGNPDEVKILRSALIPSDKFNAGFHERYGGVSQLPPIASLNTIYTMRKPDSQLAINENRRRLGQAAGFDPEQLKVARVEHGKSIWVVGKTPPAYYDGIVTNMPGITIAAPGADCSMILLADTVTGACGAVHAGWRGTTLGAVRACLKAMVDEYQTNPKDVVAAIGPTVDGKCFDLPAVDASPVHELDPSFTWPSESNIDWVHADLVKANVKMLELDGVPSSNIDTSNAYCTVCNKQFFSHRRDGIPFGNQIGFISYKA
ncbi:laccase domain-containing protein 1-like isoform X1 [Biomphalaria glabrata]|uniref:Purine nucleoside phosphorylase LACC1-like isoform X2 n=1 Tax=Biomphalaria glabrata TaxID=6526 RepID=A0A9U8EAK0_BIOGL|nr:purine nucleoside phosphorylase LACC1-like isoform X2 [Biomphalaria glabrata]KAI8755918.1 laccase domain-containing protein 1-like isoform X1 [Biomphalaria glabrata]KAI8793441.1 laccase domain-containing protein 1 isoform X1 [Biomphalaria glabrata]